MLTTFQKIFLLSKVYGQPNFQENLPVQGREWPRDTFLQRRLSELRREQSREQE